MKRKSVLFLTSVVVAAALLGGCGKADETDTASILDEVPEETVEAEEPEETEAESEEPEETEEEIPEGMYRSELTNEWIDESLKNQRPIAAMVDNEKTALPHYGLSDADVVYEMMNSTKNGRITRLMAVIKDWEKIEQLGSVRSTRPTNILLAAEWNAVLCHDGGPFYIDPYLANDYAAHFSGGFDRIKNGKPREFTEYICTGNLDSKFDASHYSREYDQFYEGKDVEGYQHFKFSDQELTLDGQDGVMDATTISLPFPHNESALKYNEDTKTYDYYDYGNKHVDPGNGDAVLTFKNVLIQNCTFHQYDENGYLIYNCIDSQRDGYYVTNGKAIPITWIKAGDTNATRYLDKDGNEISINTGKTYITLVPDDGWKDLSIE